ncbi:MAG: hypothetical protein AAGA96_10295 [Verrucomicrobiota bacterium]
MANRRRGRVDRIGWGYKPSGLWAKGREGFRLFEDGFIRSLRPGYEGGALYSIVEDRSGIYYDGDGVSDLVSGLNSDGWIAERLGAIGNWEKEAKQSLARFIEVGASKYNWFENEHSGPSIDEFIPEEGALVVDQTAGDAALRYGRAKPDSFVQMVQDALDECSNGPVYLRTHPDAVFRGRSSCFPSELLNDSRVKVLPAGFPPHRVFQRTPRVYVFNSLLGMEALIHGCSVRVYGCPFYAGWGLTDDCHPELPVRTKTRSLLELFHAAYQLYTRYYDPVSKEACSLDRILEHIRLQKVHHAERAFPKLLLRFPGWKARVISPFLTSPGYRTEIAHSASQAGEWIAENPDGKIYEWGKKNRGPKNQAIDPVLVEDGFLRSVGLGASFHRPKSLVFDSLGLYFDATQPSDLECLLQNTEFSEKELAEARNLIECLVQNQVTKYNLRDSARNPTWPTGGRRVLVPGQVQRDASLLFGEVPCQTNLEFLKLVRRENPNAVIAFKPHPDLVKRQRPGSPVLKEMRDTCDLVIEGLDILPWLDSCDEVHTLTSQSGFEAILRSKKVVCYGQPFYAGWGLTEDFKAPARRTRRLKVEELVAGALIRYPVYVHPESGEFMTPLDAAYSLSSAVAERYSSPSLPLKVVSSFKRMLHPFRSIIG